MLRHLSYSLLLKKNIFDYDFYDFVKKYVNQKINTKSKWNFYTIKSKKKRKTKTFNVKFIFENEFINIIIQKKTKMFVKDANNNVNFKLLKV